jgi:glycosyltransferase involved in cell wall biosynthesis
MPATSSSSAGRETAVSPAGAPPKVCFYAPLLWPLWSGGALPFTGGAEVQQERLARGLAARGFDVTVVGCDFGQPSPVTVHGVRVLSSYRIADGWPVLRFFHPRLTGAWRALAAAAADVYYVRGASLETGIAYEAARRRGAAFVFGAAHEHDAHRSLPELANMRDRVWYRRALRGATAVVAQTETQQRLFREQYGVASTVVRNLVELPAHTVDAGADGAVLWMGTYKRAKRPDWFLALARALPHRRFVMCGVVPAPPADASVWERARAAAATLPNLDVRGFVAHDEIEALHRTASLFVHTSPAEGFSNTVLEAWASGLPVIASADPDGILVRERLGEVVGDPEALARAVEAWMADPARRAEAGARARAYVRAHHSPEQVLERMDAVFRAAAARR